MRPGKSSGAPMRIIPKGNEFNYVLKINSITFVDDFRSVMTWEILAWKKPIFAMSEE